MLVVVLVEQEQQILNENAPAPKAGGAGGAGGGGAGGNATGHTPNSTTGVAGTANTGGGGGGGSFSGPGQSTAGAGGSGIVIVAEPAVSYTTASGVWNMDDLYTYVKADNWA